MPESNLEQDISFYVSKDIYLKNKNRINELKQKLLTHPVFSNSILIDIDKIKQIPTEIIYEIHSDYRYSIVQIFTDALLAAALSSEQLENKYLLPAGSKMIPRSLLFPNFLDEFGFKIADDKLTGSFKKAHYPLFENIINSFDLDNISPTNIAKKLRDFLQSNFYDYQKVVGLLAVVEFQVIFFTPVLNKIFKKNNINCDYEYYNVHGSSCSESSQACDDEHAEDLFSCLALISDKIDLDDLYLTLNEYLNLWDIFWNNQSHKIMSKN